MNNKLTQHCPYCTKVLFKDATFKDEANFETNCHHCRKPIQVRVEREIVITIKPMIKINLPPARKDTCG